MKGKNKVRERMNDTEATQRTEQRGQSAAVL